METFSIDDLDYYTRKTPRYLPGDKFIVVKEFMEFKIGDIFLVYLDSEKVCFDSFNGYIQHYANHDSILAITEKYVTRKPMTALEEIAWLGTDRR